MLPSNSTDGSTFAESLPDLWYNSKRRLTSSLTLLLEKTDLSVSLISEIKSSSFFDLFPLNKTKLIVGFSLTIIVKILSL